MTNELVDSYPKQMLFHTIAVAICAIRAPTDVAVVLTYYNYSAPPDDLQYLLQ